MLAPKRTHTKTDQEYFQGEFNEARVFLIDHLVASCQHQARVVGCVNAGGLNV